MAKHPHQLIKATQIGATGKVGEFRVARAGDLDYLWIKSDNNSTGLVEFDVRVNGTTIYDAPGDRPTIAVGQSQVIQIDLDDIATVAVVERDLVSLWVTAIPAFATIGARLTFQAVVEDGEAVAGPQGEVGLPGGLSIEYNFDDVTTDSDPGNGNLRLDQAVQNTATIIRVDLLDRHGTNVADIIDLLFESSTNLMKGTITLHHATDKTKWLLLAMQFIDPQTGYRNLNCVAVDSSSASPFADGDPLVLSFDIAGHQGNAGADGNKIWSGSFDPNGIGIIDAIDGDMFISTAGGGTWDLGDVWFLAGTWTVAFNIVGPQGPTGISAFARTVIPHLTASLADDAEGEEEIELGITALVFKIVADRECRLRMYATDAQRDADASRPIGELPTGEHGLLLEAIFVTGNLTLVLAPFPIVGNVETVPTDAIPSLVQNLSGGTSTIDFDFTVTQLETE